MERISLAQVYDLSAVNFLNDMAYMKDKARYEAEQHKQWLQKQKSKQT